MGERDGGETADGACANDDGGALVGGVRCVHG